MLPRCYPARFGVAAYANNHDEIFITCILECKVSCTPESGHRNRHVYHLRRTNSGSFAIFAAIRRASSLVSGFAAVRRPGSYR